MESENKKQLEKQLMQANEKCQKLALELMACMKDTNKEIQDLQEIRCLFNNYQIQINYLKNENDEFRRKIGMITDTWVGKIAITCYRSIKRIGRK